MWAGVDIENLRKSIYPQGATAGILSYAYLHQTKNHIRPVGNDEGPSAPLGRPCESLCALNEGWVPSVHLQATSEAT